jgi:putative AlgH/UPF0301 family transcriptional regulator
VGRSRNPTNTTKNSNNILTHQQRPLLRILYKGLLKKSRTFDNYPLLKAWCDDPFSPSNFPKWYSPKISFYEEIRKAFRKPHFSPNEVSQSIKYATGIYKTWNNVYSLLSSRMTNFDSYIDKKLPAHSKELLSSREVPITLLDKIEPGSLLIAHPRDDNPQWSKSLLLILKHDAQKTIGVILNKRLMTATIQFIENENPLTDYIEGDRVGEEEDTETDETETTPQPQMFYADVQYKPLSLSPHVFYGGPAKGMFILHTRKDIPKSHLLGDGLYFSQSKYNSKLFRQITSTKNYRLCVGSAEWFPGQLNSEIEKSWWFPVRCPYSVLFPKKSNTRAIIYPDPDLVSSGRRKKEIREKEGEVSITELDLTTHSDELWSKVLRLMGGEYYHFSHAEALGRTPLILFNK